MRTVVDSYWFSQLGNPRTIGIVHIIDEFDGDSFFIGNADGIDKLDDEQYIADTGAKFPLEVGAKLFNLNINLTK